MEINTTLNTRIAGFIAAALLLVVTAVLTMAGSVSAQTGPGATCTGDTSTTFGTNYFGFEEWGNRIYSTSPTSREFALSSPLEAGTYVLDGVSYDGYPGREMIDPQPREQWFAELLSADGTVLATSSVTGDIADGVQEGTWSGALGEVSIDQTAVKVRISHASPGSISINSVRPVCLGATGGPVAPAPTPPTSSIVVDYDSTNAAASDVMVVCGNLEESATGTSVDLAIDGIAAESSCAVRYTPGLSCTVVVDPASSVSATSGDGVNVQIPDEGDANIVVDIDCAGTIAAPAATTTTTTAPAVEVQGQVEAPAAAPTAQVQPGTPAFTG
ncbi:MAG: hypothetical protein R8J94_06120 [Acidimicrobiia bacterium]|nr:hypothetical protein [Acidimicrobiia bacterium]